MGHSTGSLMGLLPSGWRNHEKPRKGIIPKNGNVPLSAPIGAVFDLHHLLLLESQRPEGSLHISFEVVQV